MGCFAQVLKPVSIVGKIQANTNELEGITVFNLNSSQGTITNANGVFTIKANLHDSLQISGILFQPKTVVVSSKTIETKSININLVVVVNELSEVVVGKVLSGNLIEDMQAVKGEPITAKSLGIPSYLGPALTKRERELKEASNFQAAFYGISNSVGLIPLINAILGRTKKLKQLVKLERNVNLMSYIKTKYGAMLFSEIPLQKERHFAYFYYVSDDPNFEKICNSKNGLLILDFLKEKLREFK